MSGGLSCDHPWRQFQLGIHNVNKTASYFNDLYPTKIQNYVICDDFVALPSSPPPDPIKLKIEISIDMTAVHLLLFILVGIQRNMILAINNSAVMRYISNKNNQFIIHSSTSEY